MFKLYVRYFLKFNYERALAGDHSQFSTSAGCVCVSLMMNYNMYMYMYC